MPLVEKKVPPSLGPNPKLPIDVSLVEGSSVKREETERDATNPIPNHDN